MIKNIMQINLSALELSALLKEGLKLNCQILKSKIIYMII